MRPPDGPPREGLFLAMAGFNEAAGFTRRKRRIHGLDCRPCRGKASSFNEAAGFTRRKPRTCFNEAAGFTRRNTCCAIGRAEMAKLQ